MKWELILETRLRDVAEVICECKVLEETIAKLYGPSSIIPPCPFLQPPQGRPCPVIWQGKLGRDIQSEASL